MTTLCTLRAAGDDIFNFQDRGTSKPLTLSTGGGACGRCAALISAEKESVTVARHQTAFLFDLDGTLVDSVYQHVLAWREALDQEGIALSV